MQPVRLRRAQSRPLVGGFLPPAVQFHVMAVDPESGLRVPTHRADAERRIARVHRFAAGVKRDGNVIKIGVIRLPQLRMIERAGQVQLRARARRNVAALAQRQNRFAVAVQDLRRDLDLFV